MTAAFYNFHPGMVARAVPGCWDVVAPETLCRVRAIAAADALSEVCRVEARSDLVAALPLLRRAVAACDGAGRVMAGANRSLWPVIAPALGTAGSARPGRPARPCASTAGTGTSPRSWPTASAASMRICSRPAPRRSRPRCCGTTAAGARRSGSAPQRRLSGRGLLHADGRATDAGRTLHGAVEDLTDRLAEPAYAALSDGARAELHGALSACAADVAASGLLPFPNPMGLPRARAG